MQFLSCGLNKLAEQLSVDRFKHLNAAYPLHWKLLSKKSIYCYNYITDILLLADVFENFRKMSLETYGLDPIHYYSLSGLS